MAKTKKSEQNMTLLDHLIELRNRLLISFCAFIFLFFLCFIKFTTNNQNLADIVYNFFTSAISFSDIRKWWKNDLYCIT